MHAPLPHDSDPSRIPVGLLVTRLVDDAKAYGTARVALLKAQVGERTAGIKTVAILFGAAAVLGLATVVALLVGLILALATLVGPGWATLIVVVGTLALVGLLGWLGAKRLGRMFAEGR